MPDFLSAAVKSWFTPGIGEVRKLERDATNAVTEAALRGVVPAADLDITWPAPERTPPVWKAFEHRKNVYRSSRALRRQPVATARRVAAQGTARPPRAGVAVRARRRVGARQPAAAGLRVDVAPGRDGLGMPVHRLPGGAESPLAPAHHRREDRHRMGARQRGQVRWRPRLRRTGGYLGRRSSRGAGRPDRKRSQNYRTTCPRGPTRRWTPSSASTAAMTGRTAPPSSGPASSTSSSAWW